MMKVYYLRPKVKELVVWRYEVHDDLMIVDNVVISKSSNFTDSAGANFKFFRHMSAADARKHWNTRISKPVYGYYAVNSI